MARGIPGSGAAQEQDSNIQFFSSVDIDAKTGKVSSEFPAWYFTGQVDDLREEIRQIEGRLEKQEVPAANVPYYKSKLSKLKTRLRGIDEGRPKLTATQKDNLAKYVTEIQEEISVSMYTNSDMKRGTADAHEEARRCSTPCVKVPVELASMMGIPTEKGKVNRNDAMRMWKIGRKLLGEEAHSEILRRD